MRAYELRGYIASMKMIGERAIVDEYYLSCFVDGLYLNPR